MTPGSLRLRLLAGGAATIALALAAAWILMSLIFDRHIERRVEAEMRQQAVPLIADLHVARGVVAIGGEPEDPRFATPASGLYWQVRSGPAAARSRSLWDSALPAGPTGGAWRSRKAAGPFGQNLLLVERRVTADRGGPAADVQLGYDLAQLAPARAEFGRELAGFLVILWAALSAAAWVQVSLGLRPLRAVAGELARLQRDSSARLTGAYPREIQPLTQAIDRLAAARESDVARGRRRAADLAHGLKTPIAALAAQSRRARDAGATAAADGLDQAIAAVGSAVEAELVRARVGLAREDAGTTVALDLVERLVGVLEHTEAGERIAFAIDVPATLLLPLGVEDATELVGALIENAARYGRRRVAISGEQADGEVALIVADDGPGIAGARVGDALLRGERLDAAGPGDGLGLAIARDFTEATGGVLSLGQAAIGGLAVTAQWAAPH